MSDFAIRDWRGDDCVRREIEREGRERIPVESKRREIHRAVECGDRRPHMRGMWGYVKALQFFPLHVVEIAA